MITSTEKMEHDTQQPRCQSCRDLNVINLPPVDELRKCTSFAEVEDAAKDGCLKCDVLVKVVRHYYPKVQEQTPIAYIVRSNSHIPPTVHLFKSLNPYDWRMIQIELLSQQGRLSFQIRSLEILSVLDTPCPWADMRVSSHITGNTGSDNAVAWVRTQVDECMNKHTGCVRLEPSELPTRIIKIDGPVDVKLHVSGSEVAPYVCLSHCWGTSNMMKTTTQTLDRYQAGITWAALPKTFQEAISFAHRLGYEYIWVDSLCIIQDCVDDWRHEGSKMANIYRNASLTLSASQSPDSDSGCYAVAPTKHLSQFWSFTGPNNEPYDLYSRISINHRSFIDKKLPLLRRGWGLQERLLCPRIVHFAKEELVWECFERSTCECSQIRPYQAKDLGIAKEEVQPRLWLRQSLPQMARCWHLIVTSYTALDLTFPADIFPALQGLAKIMPSQMGEYLAGLWSETLISDLCWGAGPTSRRPEQWRAPTWSWASTIADVVWNSDFWRDETISPVQFAIVVDASTSTKGNDATGELTSGVLLLRGRGLTGAILYPTSQQQQQSDSPEIYDIYLCIDYNNRQAIFQSTELIDHCCAYWDYNPTIAGSFFVASGSPALVVKLEDYVSHYSHLYRTLWLVLIPSKHDASAYERIGLIVDDGTLDAAYNNSPEMDIKII